MATIHVDADKSIQAAIDDAESDDTIDVADGTYDESVTIDVEELTLKGPNAGHAGDDTRGAEALINRTSTPGSGGSAVSVTAADVTVDGFQIESAAQNGISVDQPVSDITIQNNRVTSVAGNTFGSSSGDRATGNGIAFGLPRSASETTVTGLEVSNNVITGVTTEDLASSEDRTTANGIQVLTRQHNVEGMNITGNVISDLEPGASGDSGDNRSRGVVINVGNDGSTIGAADGFTIADNSISGLTGAGGFSDVTGIALFEAGGAAGGSTDRIGPENFTVENNQLDDLTNTGKDPAPAIFVGGIQTLGDSHSVTGNTINSGSVIRFAGNQPGFDPATADALNASGNIFDDVDADLYYSDATDAADLDTVFNDNNFSEVDVVVGSTAITRPPTSDEVLNVDQVASFSSIQNAVDNASAGNTIVVGPGEFQGPVQVIEDQTNLTIRSAADPENTVINATDGSARSTPSFNAQAVRISVDGVTIDGFNIVGDDTIVSGVFVAGGDGGGDNVRVVNNIIEGMSRPGFGGPSDNSAGIVTAAFGGGDPEVVDGFVARNNTIRDIGSNAKKPNNPGDGTRAQGISLIDIAGDTAGDGAVIENNTISSLAGQDTTTGIAVQPLDRPTENGNNLAPGVNVQDNDVSGADVGLFLGDSGALSITDNEFSNNRVSVEDGSEAVDLNAVLQNNTFDRAVTVEDDSGNITGDSIFTTIQPTVDAASDGDTVSVSSGTYDEEVTIGKNITLTEADNNTSTPTISGQVRITGAVDSSEALEVSELDLEYDSNNAGSGKKSTILFKQNQYENVTLNSNTITAPSDGFAVYKQKSSGSSSPDDNITFENNTFKSGGSGADQLVVIEADSSNRPTSIDFESNVLTGTVNSGPALKHEGKNSIIGGSANGNDFTGGSNSEVSRNNGSVLVKTTGNSIIIEENDFPTAGGLVISAEGDGTSINNNSFDSINTDSPIIEATGENTSISGNTADGDNLPAEGESEAGNDVQNVIDQSGNNETVEIEQGGSSPDSKETYTIDQNQSEPNKNTVAINASNVIVKGESDGAELQVPDDGTGIEVDGSDTIVKDLSIEGPSNNSGTAIDVNESKTTIEDVEIGSGSAPDTGVKINDSGCTLRDSTITVNPTAAIEINGGGNVIEDSTLQTASGTSGGDGILISNAGSSENLIALNDIDSDFENGTKIDSNASNVGNVKIRFNNIRGSTNAIDNDSGTVVDARSNFWNDKTGPSGGVDDPNTGRTANGEGDAISSDVKYDEFLEIPNGFILDTGSPPTGRDTDGDGLHEDFNNDSDHFPTDGYLFLRALRQGHFDRLAAIDGTGGKLSTDYSVRFDFDGDGADDITRDDVNEMVINRNR